MLLLDLGLTLADRVAHEDIFSSCDEEMLSFFV